MKKSLLLLLSLFISLSGYAQLNSCDVNNDNTMDISDVTYLVNCILGKSTPKKLGTLDIACNMMLAGESVTYSLANNSGTLSVKSDDEGVARATLNGRVLTIHAVGAGATVVNVYSASTDSHMSKSVGFVVKVSAGEVAVPAASMTDNVITLSASNGSTIYYTLDGSDPKTNGVEYTAPIAISQDVTLRAVATDGKVYSDEITQTFTYQSPVIPDEPGDDSYIYYGQVTPGTYNADKQVFTTNSVTSVAGLTRLPSNYTGTLTDVPVTEAKKLFVVLIPATSNVVSKLSELGSESDWMNNAWCANDADNIRVTIDGIVYKVYGQYYLYGGDSTIDLLFK